MNAWIEIEQEGDNLSLKPYAQVSNGSTQHISYSFEVSQISEAGGTSQTQQSGTAVTGPEPTLLSTAGIYLYPGSRLVATLKLYQGSSVAPVKQAVLEFPPPG